MYHDVLPAREVWFDETTREFSHEMALIRKRGYSVISVERLWRRLAFGDPVPPRSVVLTFDDAGEGQFQNVLPILRQYRYPAVFFVHTGYVGVKTSKAHMTWEQLREAEQTGLVEVCGRTVSHPCNMPDLTDRQLEQELRGGADEVMKRLGHGSRFFSYPCGKHNARSERAVRLAGYLLAFDEERGYANRSTSMYAVHRFTPRRFDEAVPPSHAVSGSGSELAARSQ